MRLIARWALVHIAGGDYKQTPTQCMLNVGLVSLVLASIHSALVSTLCLWECVHIVYNVPMLIKCWPASYTMARHRTNAHDTDTLPGQWWAYVAFKPKLG